MEQEQYLDMLALLVKKELALYTKYAVRLREDGGIRHIYQTKLFKDELVNILQDDFAAMDKNRYLAERDSLDREWEAFHAEAYLSIKQGRMLPLEYMLRKLGLNAFEKHCVMLAVAPELNREFERMYSYLQDERGWKYPSLDLCVKMFSMEPLVQKRLIRQAFERKELMLCIFQPMPQALESGLSWKLKLRGDLIDYIFFYESDLLHTKAQYMLYVPSDDHFCRLNINAGIEKQLNRYLQKEADGARRLLILQGPAGSGKKLQIRLAASARGRTVLYADAGRLKNTNAGQQKERILEAVVRGALNHACLCWCRWEMLKDKESWEDGLIHEILTVSFLLFPTVFLTTETDYRPKGNMQDWEVRQFSLQPADMRKRRLLWEEYLEGTDHEEIPIKTLAAQYDFTPGMMADVVRMAKEKAQEGHVLTAQLIYEACQQMVSHRLGERASRVEAAYTWEDLVLEEEAVDLLRQACSQVTFRCQVYEEWGFLRKLAYGRGISMLFAGPPGTGKTMAAQVLAAELNLELYKVDLSGVLSKYIGETQKNLREIFDEVKKSRSILFFDEADVLFGKRVNVTDARDISANAQTAYLLQKMEEYDGITILATNLLQNFDDAYKRRMKYIIPFTFPQEKQRLLLWQQVFPKEMPLDADVDTHYLAANFELSGAAIKNIALNAAFMAAAEGEAAGMKHIVAALQQEYLKSGKILGKEELQEYSIYKKQRLQK